MKREEKEKLIWSYLDGEIVIEERLKVDRLRASNVDFEAQYQEALVVHKNLAHFPIHKISKDFSRKMESVLLQEVSKANRGFDLRPLWFFGISLLAIGFTFFLLGSESSVSTIAVPRFITDFTTPALIDAFWTQLTTLEIDLSWYYFVILLLAPCLFLLDKIAEQRFSVRHFVLV